MNRPRSDLANGRDVLIAEHPLPHRRPTVAIVGGGPVGLLLALGLHARGVSFHVYERRSQRDESYSRAIGIHPPSLAAFRELGVDRAFLEEGVRVVAGVAHANRSPLGVLSFGRLPGEFPFILTLPQARTEAILERELLRRAPGCITHGAHIRDADELDADVVVACDGWRSELREAAGLHFPGAAYPDTFLMGDFADCTPIGPRAGIYLCSRGLVESFPLPGKMRRYVVGVDEHIEQPTVADITERISQRIGEQPDPATNTMVSSFRVHHYLANHFRAGRLVLCGDAAHVLTPIGGLGMNLGWQDAVHLAEALASEPRTRDAALDRYARVRRRKARRAIRQAEMNMRLGRPGRSLGLRQHVVKTLLKSRLAPRFARSCAMM